MATIIFYDIKKAPFEIFGLHEATGNGAFHRVPEEVARATSEVVTQLYANTAGGRIRFKTDAKQVYIRATGNTEGPAYHATPLMHQGFDLYIDGGREPRFMGAVIPRWQEDPEQVAHFDLPEGEKEITINMPLYGKVTACEIGLPEGASLSAHTPYKHNVPVLFYGSSITQGACASRPGRSYEAQISRKYDMNYLNFGFSGGCRAEDAIVDFLNDHEFCAFVSDYDHNAPDVEYLRNTHYKMYEKIRAKHPDTPYFMITKPDFRFDWDSQARRAVVMESYVKAYNSGDRNVYFIDGSAFFSGRPESDLTLDRCHPNDEGMGRMADCIGDVLAKVLGL